jgi:hypothetical protein
MKAANRSRESLIGMCRQVARGHPGMDRLQSDHQSSRELLNSENWA